MKSHVRTIQRSRVRQLEYFKLTLPPELIQRHIDAGRTEVIVTEHMDGLLLVPVTPEQAAEHREGKR